MAEDAKGPGRPRLGESDDPTKRFGFDAPASQIDKFRRAARLASAPSASDWARRTLAREARRILRRAERE